MKMSRRKFITLMGATGVGLGAFSLFGCSPVATERRLDVAGDLVVAQGVDIEALDPHVTTSVASKGIMGTLYDRLADMDMDMNFIPSLATSWQVLDDHTWEMELREGVKFHNGEDFNADAVKFTVERICDPETKSIEASTFRNISEVNNKPL